MKKMKKGRGREEAKKNISRKLRSLVIVGIVVSAVMMVLIPLAAAGVTSFTITPDTGTAGAVASYRAVVNTTGVTSLNITIPAGFGAKAPTTSGVEIASAYIWDTQGRNWTLVFTAGDPPTTKIINVDGYNETGVWSGATVTFNIDYNPGGGVDISSPWLGGSYANLTLPTAAISGSLNVSIPLNITNATIDVQQYVKNPTTPDDYIFEADGKYATVHITAPPAPPVPVPEFNIFGLLALVAILAVALAFATLRRKK